MKKFIALIVCLTQFSAQAGVYSFGGGCSSLGAWSKAALSQADTIAKVVQSLKDNPDCKGIESIIPKISIASDALSKIGEDTSGAPASKRAERVESLPSELVSLRNFVVGSPELKEDVLKLLTYKSFEGASLVAESGGKEGASAPNPAESIATGLSSLNNRVRRASSIGMEMLDQVLTTLPNYNRCLVGQPDQGLAILSATVKLTAAFVSSQDGIANKMSNSISHLVTYLRNSKFTSILRVSDESEFWLSMSCLMETTTQTYCAARDAQHLLTYSIKNMSFKPQSDGTVTTSNPLEGYYVLTRDIPRVSEWLQKVMFGIKPKLQSDATYKNKILTDIHQVQLDINRIQGIFAENKINYGTLTTLEQKQNFLIGLLTKLLDNLGGGGGEGYDRDKMNFFALATSPNLMPFKLIGRNTIPDECFRRPDKLNVLSWDEWMRDQEKFQLEFHNPDALLVIIGQQLDTMIAAAEIAASNYFQNRMIVDMADLVTDAVTGQTHTVISSLRRINSYLLSFQKRLMADENGDIILVASVSDTAKHIQKVLYTYDKVKKDITDSINSNSSLDTEQINDLYKSIIEAAYKEFNVITQRDTYLSNRVSKFIQHDYVMRIKSNTKMTPHEREILLETGNELLYRITSVTSTNPTLIKDDLAAAQVVNKRNIESLEMLLKESLYPTIEELGMIADGKAPTDRDLRKKAIYRMYRDSYARYVNPSNTRFENAIGGAWAFGENFFTGGLSTWFYGMRHPDLYPTRLFTTPRVRGADDEFKSFDQFKAKLCLQTLSFEDRKFFELVCRGSVLRSAFDVENPELPASQITLNGDYDAYMTTDRKNKPVDPSSICAFQTYARRNQVYWMTLDLYSREN